MNQNLIITVIVIAALGLVGYLLLSGQGMGNIAQEAADPTADSVVDIDTQTPEVAMEEIQGSQGSKVADMQNIVEIAQSSDQFTTLVTALTQAGLVETLSSDGPFTVFAPTDEAFAKLPEETLQEVLADKEQLTSILTYHVVPGKVMAEDVVNLTSAETVQGGSLTIEVDGQSVMVDNAEVVQTDITAENGVIHVIDTVLIPQ